MGVIPKFKKELVFKLGSWRIVPGRSDRVVYVHGDRFRPRDPVLRNPFQPNEGLHLEDHPMTCKWLVTPIYKP